MASICPRSAAARVLGVAVLLTAVPRASAQEAVPQEAKTQEAKTQEATTPQRKVSPHRPVSVPVRAKEYYQSIWGVDNFLVRETASGNLIRFSYRVIEPERATALGSQQATPFLVGERSHAVLQIPTMDKIGKLRQSGAQVAGKEYWMVFSNKGHLVKSGDRVDVVIGSFHVNGLRVE